MGIGSSHASLDLRRPRTAWLVTVVVGTTALAVDLGLARGHSSYFKPAAYVAVATAAGLAGFAAAWLLVFRFRRSARLDVLLIAAGLAILSLTNLMYGAIPASFEDPANDFVPWALAAGNILGALVVTLAAFAPARTVQRSRRAVWMVMLYSVLALGMVTEALIGLSELIPIRVGQSDAYAAALAVQIFLLVLYTAASIAFLWRAELEQDSFMTWLAIAATLRVFAGIDYAVNPSLATGWLYTGDVFRVLFYIALLAAAAGEVTRYWQASREVAVLDERRRIARDLHDGLAQELAFIVRRANRAVEKGLRAADVTLIANAAERALDESRRVIATLTRPLDEPLDVVLSEAVKGVADRVGTTVALSLAPAVHVKPEVREALVRIAREAVTNAARHADAQLVRVELENGNGLTLRIVDDGRGFETLSPRRRRTGGFGFSSMADRAHEIGGVLNVESRRGAGTMVEVVLR